MSRPHATPASSPTAVFLLHIGSMDTRLIGLSIERHWKHRIQLASSLEEAGVALVDYDKPGIDDALAQLAHYPDIGVVGYAFRAESQHSRFPHHTTLRKPLNLDALPGTLAEAAATASTLSDSVASTASANIVVADSTDTRPRPQDEEPDLCGSLDDIPLIPGTPLSPKLFFEPTHYLVGHLAQAVAEALQTGRPHVVSGLPRPIGVLPHPQPICVTSFRDTQLRPFSMAQLPDATVRVVNALNVSTSGSSDTLHNTEDFLWNISAWAARGRLPAGTDPYRRVRLRAWPNFTRAWASPHALRIVALWTRDWASPVEVATRLGIPHRYVFSVFTSAHFANLLHSEPAEKPTRTPPPLPAPSTKAPQRPSILSRILRKLLYAA